jgi:signal transduction histidine kinase
MRRLNALWERLPLLARLLTTAGFALLAAGSILLFVSTGDEARSTQQELAAELATELDTLPFALSEDVVVGDYATLQQTLERYIRRPRLVEASFKDAGGATVRSADRPVSAAAPVWFVRLLGYHDESGSADVVVGGRTYGRLTLSLSAQEPAYRAWERLLRHLGVLALAVGLDFLGILLVLRNALVPLRRLEEGAEALSVDALDHRLTEEGSPEIRRLFDAFNRMADRLEKSQNQSRRSNEQLRRFSEITAHHLQEPTRRLAIFSRQLKRILNLSPENKEATETLDIIDGEARRLRNLLRDVEAWLAADQGLEPVSLSDAGQAATAAAANFQDALARIGGEIRIGALPDVFLDARRLQRVFMIAVDNAVRHHRPEADSPLRIEISAETRPDAVTLRIADNGAGIPVEYRERVFQVFERLHPQPGDVSTGVGLAILRRIAESVGGAVWIEGGEGGGTTVVVRLPSVGSI